MSFLCADVSLRNYSHIHLLRRRRNRL